MTVKEGETYFVAHGESSIVDGRPPEIGNETDIKEIHEVQPTVEDKPAGLPMVGHEAGVATRGEGEGVEEEEGEDDKDAAEDAPPQFLVHQGFDVLLAVG